MQQLLVRTYAMYEQCSLKVTSRRLSRARNAEAINTLHAAATSLWRDAKLSPMGSHSGSLMPEHG
jgi:hypothetical protein